MVIGRCQFRTVWRVRENFPPHVLNFFQGQMMIVRPSIIILQDYLSSGMFIVQCTMKLE
jgi:hypothetical protein